MAIAGDATLAAMDLAIVLLSDEMLCDPERFWRARMKARCRDTEWRSTHFQFAAVD